MASVADMVSDDVIGESVVGASIINNVKTHDLCSFETTSAGIKDCVTIKAFYF